MCAPRLPILTGFYFIYRLLSPPPPRPPLLSKILGPLQEQAVGPICLYMEEYGITYIDKI